MRSIQQNAPGKPSGLFEQSDICLFEIGDSGTVLYCRVNANGQLVGTSAEAVGRNFFDEVAPFENIDELRLRVNRFIKSGGATERFDFACQINNRVVPTKIMLVRVAERTGGAHGTTVIVDIRKI